MDIKNKHIAITGSARGLGFAMAENLIQNGAVVSVIDIDEDAVQQAVERLKQHGKVSGYVANVADESSVEALFENMKKDHDVLDGIVNNAGILRDGLLIKSKDGKVSKMPLAQWQSVIDVNLTGVFLCGREAAHWMVESEHPGVIVNISSISRAGNIGQTNYSAAKAGVSAMTVAWAKELARFGIRVADVAPGFIETEMTASMKPEARERAENMVPLKRWGQPENIAGAVRFILENDYFSGRTVEVDAALRL
ncbi:SDR family oxidoreductase [Reinekea blandensis]|uniref:3-ketoacyl-(Acyl-carrier-protein) reductase n=1 Tax=Reinekea blandensis MED297 TaxID=314283 RepID=A4BIL6_9GAMM|nr:SDR family oxidoreductase [Reinekea blandensis]EAR07980.1 3-ketoacyl-(acyl-carrier-protein) reductase [Reinekea sp. MED297] [Reinekea blandensis MED297]